MSYPELPKELIDIIDSYSDRKGLLPYLTSKDAISDLPKEIQYIIEKLIQEVSYEDSVTKIKLRRLLRAFHDEDLEFLYKFWTIVEMPWSAEKIDLAFQNDLDEILIEAFYIDPMNLTVEQTNHLLKVAIDFEDYLLAYDVSRSPRYLKSQNETNKKSKKDENYKGASEDKFPQATALDVTQLVNDIMEKLERIKWVDVKDVNEASPIDWRLRNRQLRRLYLYNRRHRQLNFIADNLINQDTSLKDIGFLGKLADYGWFDTIIKLGRVYPYTNLKFLTVVVLHPELDDEFRKIVRDLQKVQTKDISELISTLIENSYDINRHIEILKEEGANKFSAAVQTALIGSPVDFKEG